MSARTGEPAAACKPTVLGHASYVLCVLFVINVFNIVDRAIFGILINPIKQEMMLNDTQMSILAGFGFVIFYSLFAIPIGLWIDRGSRRLILAVGMVLWSGMTALSAFAQSFPMLLIARMGVGIGEAACFPVAMSLIGDYFPRAARPRAVSVFSAGSHVGVLLGALFAGWIAELYGWRSAFLVVGLPGVLVALLFFFTVREPARGGYDGGAGLAPDAAKLGPAFKAIMTNGPLLLLMLANAIAAVAIAVLAAWGPAFLQRVHGLSLGAVGTIIGPIVGGAGIVGVLGGGIVSSRLVARSGAERAALWVPIVGLVGCACGFAIFIFGKSLHVAVFGAALGNLLLASYLGPCMGTALNVATPRDRALVSSILILTGNLFSFGVGTAVVGILSDRFTPQFGELALRYALAWMPLAPLLGNVFMIMAYRALKPRVVKPSDLP